MTAPAYVDFETRSRADLKVLGGRRYCEHPSTEVICGVLRLPDGEWHELTQWDFEHEAMPEWDQVVAHNATSFDRFVWRKLGWPEPRRWIDTAELAKVAGYHTAKLEGLAEHLLNREKDMEGNELTLSLSKPEAYYGPALAERLEQAKLAWRLEHPKGCGLRLPTPRLKADVGAELDRLAFPAAPIDPEVLARIVRYCRTDVEIMIELAEGFLLQWLDSDLPGLEAADRALNDRGICFDRDLAWLLIDVDAALSEQALERAGVARTVVASPAQLIGALAALGVEVDNAQAPTLEALLDRPGLPAQARLLIEARQASSSIAAGKLRAGLARCSDDGRLRGNRTYMGAHTGRWSGIGMQLDNLAGGD
jgi:DNA polymerase